MPSKDYKIGNRERKKTQKKKKKTMENIIKNIYEYNQN